MVVVAALIGVALVKPWTKPEPVAPPPATAAPTAAASRPAATQTSSTAVVPRVDPITMIDWSTVGASVHPHDAWGIRAVVYRPDNTVREVWAPIHSSDADVQAADSNADAYAVLGWDGTTVALGVTTPLGDLPLDVRAWRDIAGDPQSPVARRNVPLIGSTPSGDPSSRLLRVSDEWSSVNAWARGEYQVDVLLESGVLHIHLWLDGDGGPVPVLSKPRVAPANAELRTIAAAPGAFIASGSGSVSYLFLGLPPNALVHDERDSWLALTSDQVFWVDGVVDRQSAVLGTANLLGAAVAPGQVLLSAHLREIAPVAVDLGSGEVLAGAPGPAGGPGAVAVFRAANPDVGFPDAVYRIDATVHTDHGNAAVSWDLPVMARPTTTESPLLTADRNWAFEQTGQWAVLAPGYNRVRVTPLSEGLPSDPGTDCSGGASFGKALPYVGVAHPGGRFDSVTVTNLAWPPVGAAVAVQVSQLANGVVALQPIGTSWPAGRYGISMQTGAIVRNVTFCVR